MGIPRPIGGLLLAVLLAVTACGGTEPLTALSAAAEAGRCVASYEPGKDYFPVKQTVAHATNFTLVYAKNYQVVTVKRPAPGARPETYVLVRCGTPAPELTGELTGATTIETPIETLYSASTTHLSFVTDLDVLDRLKGVASAGFVSSADVLEQVRSGAVTEYASGQEIDTEKVIAAKPDVLMTAGIEDKAYGPLRQAGIKVLANAEWLEPTPLGRAEWIRLMAALTGTETVANVLFGESAARYTALAAKTKGVAPVHVLSGQMYEGLWSTPTGSSYVGALTKDAGGTYPWADTTGEGNTTLDLEAVLAKSKDAKVWLTTDSTWKSLADVRKADTRYAKFTAFKTGDVWAANKALGPGGGNDLYERGVGHPDLILADLVAILHPSLAPGHEFTFYQKMSR